MSSPYIPNHSDYPDRRVASSPAMSTMTTPESREPSIRPMRLKVLYTFDDQNKTNCLARWPQILNIRTAYLDESMQVGVIELKTCIQAIVAASPELVAKLGQDYTVYAFDYSEYETPLVGQGMLSWVLASASTTPSAPADQSSTVVTGRVCKNIMGLFGNGIQETLEVKLRLVPVPTCLQSDYIESMRKYRDLSRVIPEGFDAQGWTEFLKANPSILSVAEQSRSQSPASAFGQSQQHGIEHVQRLMSEGYGPPSARSVSNHQPAHQASHQRRDSIATTVVSGLGSPTPSAQSLPTAQAPTQYSQHSRAGSRTSNRESMPQTRRPSVSNSTDIGYLSNEDRQDEGPARKRAKVTKASHPGKSSAFGKKVDSLRVTASTAASIRVFQPTAIRPPANVAQALDGPPRAPTPIPQAGQKRRDLRPTPKSNLSEALVTSDSGYKSQQMISDQYQVTESELTSPEVNRAFSMTNSPEEPASSPPVIRDVSVMPSSPVLPALLSNEESFMDSSLDNLFSDDNFNSTGNEDTPLTEEDAKIASRYSMRPELAALHAPSEAPTEQVPPSLSKEEQTAAEKSKQLSITNAHKALGLKRSQTWSGDQPRSDPPRASSRPSNLVRSGSMASAGSKKSANKGAWDKNQRRNAIQSKLNRSIEKGEIPPFCENCGAIETPIWRKTYSRLHSGDHSYVHVSGEPGGIVALQILETNEDGSTKIFKIFKKNKSTEPEDAGFTDVLLCNPCGIWLSNRKQMRPEHLWDKNKKNSETRDGKPRRDRKKKTKKETETDQSDMLAPSESVVPASELMIPQSEASLAPFDGPSEQASRPRQTQIEPIPASDRPDEAGQLELPPLKKPRLSGDKADQSSVTRSESAVNQSALAALQRAIQSSPGRFLGSKQSPIEVDKNSTASTRRALFRSPKTSGPLGVSIDKSNGARKLPKTPNETLRQAEVVDGEADKENLPPRPSTPDDGLDDLFSDFPPITPSMNSSNGMLASPSDLFKTPVARSSTHKHTLTTGDFFSSAAKAFLHPARTPARTPTKSFSNNRPDLTPFTHHLNQLLSETGAQSPSPGRLFSEIGNLPDLGSSENKAGLNMNDGGTPSRMFRSHDDQSNTQDFDFSAFQSSDGPMPSSPPGWFGVYEDPVEGEGGWGLGFGNSPVKGVGKAMETVVETVEGRGEWGGGVAE